MPDTSPQNRRVLNKEEFEAKRAELLQEGPDYVVVETPDSDDRLLEELLDIEPNTVPKFTCRFLKGHESCAHCGRNFSILDKAKTGLEAQAHNKQFMADTIFGKHADYFWNGTKQDHACFSCGRKAPQQFFYANNCYACG